MLKQYSRSWLIIGAVVALWFFPWWGQGKVMAPLDLLNGVMTPWSDAHGVEFPKNHFVSDGVDQYLVYHLLAKRSYEEEGWIGWSDLTYGGTAEYANTMALYFDWTLQLHRWFDFWTAWHLGLIGQVLIACGGMLLFLRGRGITESWAVCGALLYGFNSQFITWVFHRWSLGSFCWVPLVLWAIDRREKRSKAANLLPALFIALAFLGGSLQHGVLVVLVVVIRWLEDVFKLWRSKERNASLRSRLQLKRQAGILGRYVSWGVFAFCLSAMMWLPCIAAFIESEKLGLHIGLHGHADGFYPMGPLQPVFNFLAYGLQWFPSAFGSANSLDVLKLFKSELFYVAYFGAIPVLIALWSVFRKSTSIFARILIIAGLVLPLTPLVRLLSQRLFMLFILGGILAFVQFMQTSSKEERGRFASVLVKGLIVMVGGWTLFSLVLFWWPGLVEKLHAELVSRAVGSSFGYYTDWINERVDRFISNLFIWSPAQLLPLLLLATGVIALSFTSRSKTRFRQQGAKVLAVVAVVEVLLFGIRWVVWSDPVQQPLFPETPESQALEERVGRDGRVTTVIHPSAHLPKTPFVPNTLAPYGIATIQGYDSIMPVGMVIVTDPPDDAQTLGRAGVTHLVTWAGNEQIPQPWNLVWSSSNMDLYENPLAVPRYQGFTSEADLEDFLDGSGKQGVRLNEGTGLMNSRLIDVPAGIRWIRIAENAGAGWEYRYGSDTDWQAVSRAQDASMLVKNLDPNNDVQLEMRYAPPLRKIGLIISGISLLTFILGFGYVIRPTGSRLTGNM